MKDGSLSYQERPCEPSSTALKTEVKSGDPMVGCYASAPSYGVSERFEVKQERNAYSKRTVLNLYAIDKPSWNGSELQTATADQVHAIGEAYHFDAKQGLTFGARGSRLPEGLYRGRNTAGEEGYFFVLQQRAIPAKRITCS
nr:hypothetical protein [Andreprevotia chitinilytica]